MTRLKRYIIFWKNWKDMFKRTWAFFQYRYRKIQWQGWGCNKGILMVPPHWLRHNTTGHSAKLLRDFQEHSLHYSSYSADLHIMHRHKSKNKIQNSLVWKIIYWSYSRNIFCMNNTSLPESKQRKYGKEE